MVEAGRWADFRCLPISPVRTRLQYPNLQDRRTHGDIQRRQRQCRSSPEDAGQLWAALQVLTGLGGQRRQRRRAGRMSSQQTGILERKRARLPDRIRLQKLGFQQSGSHAREIIIKANWSTCRLVSRSGDVSQRTTPWLSGRAVPSTCRVSRFTTATRHPATPGGSG